MNPKIICKLVNNTKLRLAVFGFYWFVMLKSKKLTDVLVKFIFHFFSKLNTLSIQKQHIHTQLLLNQEDLLNNKKFD